LQVAVFHVAGDNNSSKEAMSHGYPQTWKVISIQWGIENETPLNKLWIVWSQKKMIINGQKQRLKIKKFLFLSWKVEIRQVEGWRHLSIIQFLWLIES
jgi:hypothetical protein